MDKIQEIVESQIRTDYPAFKAGDKIKVHVRVIEGDKERIQVYEGDVIAINGGGITKSFTVRKMSSGVGVERIFPSNSPFIDKIEMIKRGKVRRSRIFYLRDRKGKAARIKERYNRK